MKVDTVLACEILGLVTDKHSGEKRDVVESEKDDRRVTAQQLENIPQSRYVENE